MLPDSANEVLNQPPPLVGYNLFLADQGLCDAVRANGGQATGLREFGEALGCREAIELGAQANAHPPVLHTHDRFGRRRDEVEFHPAWHEMMTLGMAAGIHASPWAEPRPGAHVDRAAAVILLVQVEAGVQCPLTMTYGSVPALRRDAALAAEWLPKIYARHYDRRFRPAPEKTACLVGMGMTEKQGGSDLRTNMTRAEPDGAGFWRLTGHKWFFSAPMCDAFLVLAQAPKGLSCFFVPRWTPDGEVNALRLQRLKDKLGNKSNASSEVEFEGAWARLLGEEGRGIPTIIEMGNYTRLDCALGTAGLMRQSVAQATHHARHRTAFQRRLADQPLMTGVLADLALESEAATAMALRLARAYDRQDDPAEAAFARFMTPAAKYWICKRGPAVAVEAMEVLGGNGYVEEAPMARLYREMPVNSIWEGSGNVMCLDVLRALQRTPEAAAVLRAELSAARAAEPRLDAHAARLEAALAKPSEDQARRLVQDLVLAVQAALLIRHAPPEVADGFCASRLGDTRLGAFGALPSGIDVRSIVERATPVVDAV